MLSKEKIDPKALKTLERLMADPVLSEHFLVGGNALALHGNPRKSMDVDMFTRKPIDVNALHDHLVKNYGFVERFRSKNTIKGDIDGIDTDMITFDYPFVEPLDERKVQLVGCRKKTGRYDKTPQYRVQDFFHGKALQGWKRLIGMHGVVESTMVIY